ncbi:hypothetical protein CIPAW_03G150700 [Carya illinoinensis]|uniref:Uncharacterized protein n=1 Tax=Carya illinoinensis TaxID=32201 RepID=A0A8T1R2I7_CARIL|nr:hypothetical protein CIPAW_03G150700 [Carya illinoinensis]
MHIMIISLKGWPLNREQEQNGTAEYNIVRKVKEHHKKKAKEAKKLSLKHNRSSRPSKPAVPSPSKSWSKRKPHAKKGFEENDLFNRSFTQLHNFHWIIHSHCSRLKNSLRGPIATAAQPPPPLRIFISIQLA